MNDYPSVIAWSRREGITEMNIMFIRRFFSPLILGFLSAILIAVLIVINTRTPFRHRKSIPTNQEFIEHFKKHRKTFVKLKDMIHADHHIFRVSQWEVNDISLKESGCLLKSASNDIDDDVIEGLKIVGLELNRYQKYLDLLYKVDAYGITKKSDKISGIQVTFHLYDHYHGYSDVSTSKDIVYFLKSPNNYVSETGEHVIFFDKIDDQWYIKYEQQDES